MPIPVVARHNLDAFIPDTEIVVKIPVGTHGEIIRELRNDIVLVDFKIPGMSALRVAVNDLDMQDRLELIVDQMAAIHRTPAKNLMESQQSIAKLVMQMLRFLASDSDSKQVERFITEYQVALRWAYASREKDKKDDKK